MLPKIDKEKDNINGIEITDKILITAVKDIDKATSPLANDVRMFDVAPPGAVAIIITPIAIAGGRGIIKIKIIATIGRIIIWEKKPTKNSLGLRSILEKSLKVRPKPKENIIKARAIGRIISVIMFIIILY